MTETKWTPGPWDLDPGEELPTAALGRDDVEVFAGHRCVAVVRGVNDARLIAAAPDLYEALARMVEAFEGVGETTSPACAAARAALAQARGER